MIVNAWSLPQFTLTEPLGDITVLDLDLRGENATPVAVMLRAESIPFLLTTGNSVRKSSETSGPLAGVINLGKPTPLEVIARLVEGVLLEDDE